jgi:hypothetical protein
MSFRRMVIEQVGGKYVVLVDVTWLADQLTPDECLGSVASAIYGPGPARFARKAPEVTRAGLDLLRRERKASDDV